MFDVTEKSQNRSTDLTTGDERPWERPVGQDGLAYIAVRGSRSVENCEDSSGPGGHCSVAQRNNGSDEGEDGEVHRGLYRWLAKLGRCL